MVLSDRLLDVHAEADEFNSLELVRSLFVDIEVAGQSRPQLVGRDGAIEIPESLYRVLKEIVPILLQKRSVSIVAADEELTTQQAADMLNVSRQHIVNLIDSGELPAHMIGTHRRIVMRDLLEYRHQRRASQDKSLDELAQFSLDEGMYDKHLEER